MRKTAIAGAAAVRPGLDIVGLGALMLALAGCGGGSGSGADATSTAASVAIVTPASAAPAATPTPTPTPASVVPAGYTVVPAVNFGVKCDGVSNDTSSLGNALGSLQPQQALQLPAGTCLFSSQLMLQGKTNVMVFGAGKDATILSAADPLHSSFVLTQDTGVILNGFQVTSPNSTTRTGDANSRGFYVEKSSGVTLDGVKATKTSGAGVLFYIVTDSKVINSEVDNSLADAFHFTGASANILVQNNKASGSGDDCFASVGYGTDLNRNIQFLDNSCSDNQASGVTFEGTMGGQAWRNQLTRTGVAAIRVASDSGWNTGGDDAIDVRDNVLSDVKTRTDVDHPAVLVYSSSANITNVTITGTQVSNPRSGTAAQVINYVTLGGVVSGISISGMKVTSNGKVGQCVSEVNAFVTTSGNTLNGAAC